MPYQIKHEGGKFCVYNTNTGAKKGTHATLEKAKKQMALLEGIAHGWTPTKSKK